MGKDYSFPRKIKTGIVGGLAALVLGSASPSKADLCDGCGLSSAYASVTVGVGGPYDMDNYGGKSDSSYISLKEGVSIRVRVSAPDVNVVGYGFSVEKGSSLWRFVEDHYAFDIPNAINGIIERQEGNGYAKSFLNRIKIDNRAICPVSGGVLEIADGIKGDVVWPEDEFYFSEEDADSLYEKTGLELIERVSTAHNPAIESSDYREHGEEKDGLHLFNLSLAAGILGLLGFGGYIINKIRSRDRSEQPPVRKHDW